MTDTSIRETLSDREIITIDETPVDVVGHALPATDPLFAAQWHLLNNSFAGIDLNVMAAWADYTGRGVALAAIDNGFDYTHPDLAPNYLLSSDVDVLQDDTDAAPSFSTDNHGTAVAGVMVADDNGAGVMGVAPDAAFAGIRMGFGSLTTLANMVQAFEAARTFDVVNSSWGYAASFSDSSLDATFAPVFSAIQSAAQFGRDGLGTILTFSAGNARRSGDSSNYHNFQNSPYAIAVGAVDNDGKSSDFSSPGANLLVSAPGKDILTTDRVGAAGYGSGETATISGTSFSAPAVAGVVALMLEANPNLGYRDVQDILAYSARKLDVTSYGQALWGGYATSGADNWNGGGLHYSHLYGFGLVDARAAVRLAEHWHAGQGTYATQDTATVSAAPSLAMPLGVSTLETSLTMAENLRIDTVRVTLNIAHTYRGDLTATLISPDGTQSILLNRIGRDPGAPSGFGSSTDNINFTFSAQNFRGELSAGTWTLRLQDAFTGADAGRLGSWSLEVLGDTETADDLYVFTDEFASFSGAELAARSVIIDADGGGDMLNLSALTAGATLNMLLGTGLIAGQAVTIEASTIIETVYGGDGNDSVIASAGDKSLFGGRGADTLTGSSGNDLIDGEGGNDSLLGGTGNDQMRGADGADYLAGNDGMDTMSGGMGNDTMLGGGGDDLLTGGDGNDEMNGNTGHDTLYGSFGDDALRGTSGNDTLYGEEGADTLSGGSDHDLLLGADGADVLIGESGNDTLDGGLGADSLTGNSGNDLFRFAGDGGTITDFNNRFDLIDLTTFAVNFGDLAITSGGTGSVIEVMIAGSSAATITVLAVPVLVADDFLF